MDHCSQRQAGEVNTCGSLHVAIISLMNYNVLKCSRPRVSNDLQSIFQMVLLWGAEEFCFLKTIIIGSITIITSDKHSLLCIVISH